MHGVTLFVMLRGYGESASNQLFFMLLLLLLLLLLVCQYVVHCAACAPLYLKSPCFSSCQLTVNMHTLNAVLLLGDTALNCLVN